MELPETGYRPPQPRKKERPRLEIEDSMDMLSSEIKEFWNTRDNSSLAWTVYIMMNMANVMTFIYNAAPGWGWTNEIVGQDTIEGNVYGWYGMWYVCWRLVDADELSRRHEVCSLMADMKFVPQWWKACQAMATIVLIVGFSTFVVMTFYMFARTLNRNMGLMITGMVLNFICGIVGIILFVVFCVMFLREAFWCCGPDEVREIISWQLWYCFILCCISTTFYIAAGIAGLFEVFELQRAKMEGIDELNPGMMDDESLYDPMRMHNFGLRAPMEYYR